MTVPVVEGSLYWSFGEVEARLVEAMQFQWRIEGGRWAFASDGPWHLIVRDWWDWAAHEDKPVPRIPLSREQLARMDEASAWLAHAPERDRKLVVLAIMALAAGRKVVPYRALLKPMGLTMGADGLRKRYGRAITCICNALNAAEIRA
ncbi:hypothetical protein FIM10_02080 [Sphingomonadales bacterium 56]|uniref:hypothetical protein n=1 Tax=Sphingobium sp. S6 TaxID=2758386 RepID=UPI0019193C3F|nr:hypothetical protein [Sphingobium sp. S6]MBY2927470.1 hypothetical protein [Sphingomonadales bacterium 56]CAD7335290.1 hypothetical protein SPHS6_00424 [Sphingobium sp. S6]